VDSFILFLASSIYLFLRFCWRTTHAWLIYILLLAHTCLAYLYFTFGVHTHIVDSSIYLFLRFCWRTTHACWLIYILLLAHTCLAYLYFTFGVHTHIVDSSIYLVLRFWRTTHVWLIYILLLAYAFGAHTHLDLFIFYFWRAHTYA